MGSFLANFVLPALLLLAASINSSLISFVYFSAFLVILYNARTIGYKCGKHLYLLWIIIFFSLIVSLCQVVYIILLHLQVRWIGESTWWAQVIGLAIAGSWNKPTGYYIFAVQLLVALVALALICWKDFDPFSRQDTFCGRFLTSAEHLGFHLQRVSFWLFPVIQLAAGISSPSWLSLPYFVGSCVGLVDWSLRSNFLGLFRWWKHLQLYASLNMMLLYIYQLPFELTGTLGQAADLIGLFKLCEASDWLKLLSGFFLLFFYVTLCFIRCDLERMDCALSNEDNNLSEQFLPRRQFYFIAESRYQTRFPNILSSGVVFRTFCINVFTYGFPVSFFALSYWSFQFASLCAFMLLAYVGYIIYVFPSLFRLHHLNGLLLVFILLWAVCTFIFNIVFPFLIQKQGPDMGIWDMVGLWHYPVPGLFLFAQYGLGVLVALGNLVNNSVFFYLSDECDLSENYSYVQVEDTKVYIVATLAWGLRKSSRAIALILIFLIASKPGLVHAIYVIFFLIYLLRHTIGLKVRQLLIAVCEIHFSILYILEIGFISQALEKCPTCTAILQQLGLLPYQCPWDFIEIALLACLCAIHNHGFDMLFALSEIVQHIPSPPLGFGILKAGLNKSILLMVYASSASRQESGIASFLANIGMKFLSVYRSCGTYIAFVTILFTVCLVSPNYISFGYITLLLFWMIGRQLVEKTKKRLWYPLKAYALVVFLFVYSLSSFQSFRALLSKYIDLHHLGYSTETSLFKNVWESLAVLVVMQLYSYERRQSQYRASEESLDRVIFGFFRRFLIWHSQKIFSVALFYASLSPISASGLVYLVGLLLCSILPKDSRIPSKSFLLFTGFMVAIEYLYQLLGMQARMFPGQEYSYLSDFLGLQKYDSGFWGLEVGLRAKVLVVAACSLQYNVFRWLDKMGSAALVKGRWVEPCPLFASHETAIASDSFASDERFWLRDYHVSCERNDEAMKGSLPADIYQSLESGPNIAGVSDEDVPKQITLECMWHSISETRKCDKRRNLYLRKERFKRQMALIKAYFEFLVENMFNLFGLEINMLGLLLASFALLNVVSLLYIALLGAFILMERELIRRIWSVFVCLCASILTLEYLTIWRSTFSLDNDVLETQLRCHDCWNGAALNHLYCKSCWLGITLDDPHILLSYFVVFMLACFKLRADRLASEADSSTYLKLSSQRYNSLVWNDLSFENKNLWTILDYLRFNCYRYLLDFVLFSILMTGTLEYDVLHFGYLAFALVFFRMRSVILRKKNRIFKYLRIYNFLLITLTLAYQSPFVGTLSVGGKGTIELIYEVVGFYRYEYGFCFTARSAIVEIVIFVLVSLQSHVFSSREFCHVTRYLEAEKIGNISRVQEKKAAWKTAQLHYIRESEYKKIQRNLQVEKIKSEMLNLQFEFHSKTFVTDTDKSSVTTSGLRRRRRTTNIEARSTSIGDIITTDQWKISPESAFFDSDKPPCDDEFPGTMISPTFPVDIMHEITEEREASSERTIKRTKERSEENSSTSALQLIGEGVSHIQSIGNQSVTNLVNFFIIEDDVFDDNEVIQTEDEVYDKLESQEKDVNLIHTSSHHSTMSGDDTFWQIGKIVRHVWFQMQSNNDVVCYCCFVFAFLWNFSLLSMVYLAALYIYALCASSGPNSIFWVIMLIYSEMYLLVEYIYQIIIHHSGLNFSFDILKEVGFPSHEIDSSFVISVFPLFLVYLFTLIQTSITGRESEWIPSGDLKSHERNVCNKKDSLAHNRFKDKAKDLLDASLDRIKLLTGSLYRYWISLVQGAESPPHFIQVSMDVHPWPDDGIQPETIETGMNNLLKLIHNEKCHKDLRLCPYSSKVHVQSIEKSGEGTNETLVVLEVVYASSQTSCIGAEWDKSLSPAADVVNEIEEARVSGFVEDFGFPYKILSVIGGGKREIDLYAYIFGADLIVFFLVAAFYQSISKNKSELLDVSQLEDQFPKEFVFILMIIFGLIVVDRCIYLCSFAIGKVMYYVFNLILFIYSVTKYVWTIQPFQEHASGLALRAIFLSKALSLALQATQIRYGIPHQSTRYQQFLTSQISRINYLGYRLYRALPFLYELRCVLDWSCTATSLTMYDWLLLEDIYASLFLVKCDAVLNRSKHKQGEKQAKSTKFFSGICLFFILLFVIWAPMLIYSSGNPTNVVNPIKDASAKVDIKTTSGRLTLYQSTLCKKLSWSNLNVNVDLDPRGYFNAYNKDDIQLICCHGDSSSQWLVPEVVETRFMQSLSYDTELDIIFIWVLTRDRPKGKEVVKYESHVDPLYLPLESDVQRVLNGSASSFVVHNLYQRFFRVTGSGEYRPLEQEMDAVNAKMTMNRNDSRWWSFQDMNATISSACGDLKGPMAIVVSEETPPHGIIGDTISKFSIWGLYITFVLAVGRFIRLQCSDLRMRIPYENLPSCDRLLAICEDIYGARAEGELGVEEVLFWTLIKIYRTPHMLLEYTKPD